MPESKSSLNIAVVIFVALGSLSFGYAASIISTTLAQPSFIAYFELDTRSNTPAIEGAMNGLYTVGGLFGSVSAWPLSQKLGRRWAIFIAAITSVIGGGLQAGSVDLTMFILMRFVTGLGVGATLMLVPLYQSEVSPPHSRGLLVGIHGLTITVGYTSSTWIGLAFYFVNASGAQWRIPLAIQALPPLLLAFGILYLPETPRWLISQDRRDEALAIVQRLHADKNGDNSFALREFKQIESQFEIDNAKHVSYKDMLIKRSYRKRAIIGFAVMFAPQTTGTTVINNYGPLLYGTLGYGTVDQLLFTCGWITLALFGNTFNAFTLDHVGRVRALQIGLGGCILALIGECVAFSTFEKDPNNRSAAIASVVFLFLHIFAFSFNVDATSYVYISEIFPTHIRSQGMAISVSGYFLSLLIYLEAAPTAFKNIGWKYYLVFLSGTTFFLIFIHMYCPETKGLSLEEINKLFGDQVTEVSITEHNETTTSNMKKDIFEAKLVP
jgi:sugar porter (SP) family MFS transporter